MSPSHIDVKAGFQQPEKYPTNRLSSLEQQPEGTFLPVKDKKLKFLVLEFLFYYFYTIIITLNSA